MVGRTILQNKFMLHSLQYPMYYIHSDVIHRPPDLLDLATGPLYRLLALPTLVLWFLDPRTAL